MAIADGASVPLAIHATAATPHEVTLVKATLAKLLPRARPHRLIGDGAYDSDPLDEELQREKIELIAPHKKNRVTPNTQDGRTLRRYKRRWKIERLFAWLQNFRRLVTRYEYRLRNFEGFVALGCIIIYLRQL